MATHVVGTSVDRRVTLKKLDAIAWGLFFIWVGVVLLAHLGWGTGLVGIGILIFGGQIARKYLALGFETFWVLVGTLFVLGGVWESLNVRVSMIPIICIAAGVLLLVSAFFDKRRS